MSIYVYIISGCIYICIHIIYIHVLCWVEWSVYDTTLYIKCRYIYYLWNQFHVQSKNVACVVNCVSSNQADSGSIPNVILNTLGQHRLLDDKQRLETTSSSSSGILIQIRFLIIDTQQSNAYIDAKQRLHTSSYMGQWRYKGVMSRRPCTTSQSNSLVDFYQSLMIIAVKVF